MELPPRPALFDFNGVSMTRYFTDNWENVQNFKARPDDIVIATYPKAGGTIGIIMLLKSSSFYVDQSSDHQRACIYLLLISGTTWVSYILDLLYFGQTCPERQASIPLQKRVPFLDISLPSLPTG